MQNMWNYGYRLDEKLISKNGNEWFNIVVTPAGASIDVDRMFGLNLYKQFRSVNLNVDLDESAAPVDSAPAVDVDATEF